MAQLSRVSLTCLVKDDDSTTWLMVVTWDDPSDTAIEMSSCVSAALPSSGDCRTVEEDSIRLLELVQLSITDDFLTVTVDVADSVTKVSFSCPVSAGLSMLISSLLVRRSPVVVLFVQEVSTLSLTILVDLTVELDSSVPLSLATMVVEVSL